MSGTTHGYPDPNSSTGSLPHFEAATLYQAIVTMLHTNPEILNGTGQFSALHVRVTLQDATFDPEGVLHWNEKVTLVLYTKTGQQVPLPSNPRSMDDVFSAVTALVQAGGITMRNFLITNDGFIVPLRSEELEKGTPTTTH